MFVSLLGCCCSFGAVRKQKLEVEGKGKGKEKEGSEKEIELGYTFAKRGKEKGETG